MKILTEKEISDIFEKLYSINISIYSQLQNEPHLTSEIMRNTADIARVIRKEDELINRNKILYAAH